MIRQRLLLLLFPLAILLVGASFLVPAPVLAAQSLPNTGCQQGAPAGSQFGCPEGMVCTNKGKCIDISSTPFTRGEQGSGNTGGASSSGKTGSQNCSDVCKGDTTGLCIPNPLTDCTIIDFLNRVIDWLIYISLFVAVVMVIYAGILYVTGGGNTEKVKRATHTLIYALVGLAVVLLSKALAEIVRSILGG